MCKHTLGVCSDLTYLYEMERNWYHSITVAATECPALPAVSALWRLPVPSNNDGSDLRARSVGTRVKLPVYH
ncbi:hypothetical protein CGRA01v4_07131 [Colletotrichum graminicola]|nr:hypothetical protein CGRA01v4_07131 [Colletotrichum graminicola]